MVIKLLAVTVSLNLVVPEVLAVRFPNPVVLPTAPVKVTLPVPPFTVKLLFPFTVLSKLIPLPLRIGLLAIVTASP